MKGDYHMHYRLGLTAAKCSLAGTVVLLLAVSSARADNLGNTEGEAAPTPSLTNADNSPLSTVPSLPRAESRESEGVGAAPGPVETTLDQPIGNVFPEVTGLAFQPIYLCTKLVV